MTDPQTNFRLALDVSHKQCHEAADAFWKYWNENGETHKHGYYESTWGAINRAIRLIGVRPWPEVSNDSSDPTAVVEARERSSGRDALQAKITALQQRLNEIGDYAHDRSTGPAVWDALWEVRRMAYEGMDLGGDFDDSSPPIEAHASQAQHRQDGQEQTPSQQGEEEKT